MKYYLGVDVGTGSARVGLFDENGLLVSVAKSEIKTQTYAGLYHEQSSQNIWSSICIASKKILKESKIPIDKIVSIGFDATCSLVALDENFKPLSVGKHNVDEWNVILWMDHRANKETHQINLKKYESLKYLGGRVSIEMQLPKLLWLKNNKQQLFNKFRYFFDLPDFLVFKATGKIVRSKCSLGCKWNYMPFEKKWDEKLLSDIGLKKLLDDKNKISSNKIEAPTRLAGSLSKKAADELGLKEGTDVAVSMIDAHAGALSMLGTELENFDKIDSRVALIAGTSNCLMTLSKDKKFINGLWGPYYEVILPGFWTQECGQSAFGSLIDYILKYSISIKTHLQKYSIESVFDYLEKKIMSMPDWEELTSNYHVLPYYLGNRSPYSDPTLKGVVSGLQLNTNYEYEIIQYIATIQGLCYEARDIIETLNNGGYNIKEIVLTGGFVHNKVFIYTLANVTNLKIIIPEEKEAVLLGSALNAYLAHNNSEKDYIKITKKFVRADKHKIYPHPKFKKYHDKKYQIYKEMHKDYLKYKKIMNPETLKKS